MVKQKNQNIFSRAYNYLEKGYIKMSNWFTEKGIPLNSLNNYLEKKGLPAFAIVLSVLILLILIILFLIFFVFSKTTLVFSFQDFQSNSVTNVYVEISSSSEKIFSGIIENNSSRKIRLRVGETYYLTATKDGLPDYYQELLITDKSQGIFIVFDEFVEYGILKVRLKDRENERIISSGKITANFYVNNSLVVVEEIVNILDNHFITLKLPLNKDIELIARADNYEDFKETNFRMASKEQERIISLDISRLDFEGKSKVTFIVLDKDQKVIDDAIVSVLNFARDEIASQQTIDGKALVYVDTGETISYTIKKEGYKTYLSDDQISRRIINLEETISVTLEEGGNFIEVNVRSGDNFLSLEDVMVTLYNTNNVVIDFDKTNSLGYVRFSGIDSTNPELIVIACKESYFCEHEIVNIQETSKIDFILERVNVVNSSILSVFVVDEKNMPVSNATIEIYNVLEEDVIIPYNRSLKTDVTGSLLIPLKIDNIYRVYAFVGESFDYEDIIISVSRENKIIFVINDASRIIKLDIYDENQEKIDTGHLLIKTKDGTVLYDSFIIPGDEIVFDTRGYKDLIAKITDDEFNITTVNFSAEDAGSDGYLRLDVLKDRNLTDYPIIEFVGVINDRGERTNFITPNKDYFLIFDVLFPRNVHQGEVHIRAGDDTQTDSEKMSYGITGFSAIDATNFKYGTTYNPLPEPGNQSIDVLNQGSSQVLNKWLELRWRDETALDNKQIRIKVRAIDTSVSKLIFNYRVLYSENNLYFRDPIDSVLNQDFSSNQREALYADTKSIEISLFDVPVDCKDDFCISYKFIDSNDNEFLKDDFFAIKDRSYLLELNIFSLTNNQVNILAETSRSFPLISFNQIFDTRYQNIISDTFNNNLEILREGISLNAGVLKKVYLSFIAKEIGTSYIDLKSKGFITDNVLFDERITFNIYDEREMKVTIDPDIFIPYGSRFTINVIDSKTLEPIENAFISFYDDRGQFISSQRAQGTNGRNGIYTIENKFDVSRVSVLVESYGYAPYDRELYIVDDTLLTISPQEIFVNLGLDQITAQTNFTMFNNSNYSAENIRFGHPIWVDGSDQIAIEVRGMNVISRNSSQSFDLVVAIPNNFNFQSAYAYVPIYARIGSREVSNVIPIRINKGLVLGDCLEITPHEVNSFVGLNRRHSPPDLFNTPFNNYNFDNFNHQQNPLLAPYQSNSSYFDYMQSQNYTQTHTSNPNTLTYTDPNYYTYYSSKPITREEYTENTTFFIIKNNCDQAITFTPQSILKNTTSNQDLELSLAHVTVLPGEEKVYDVIIKNHSDRTTPTKYTFDILWHNNFYSVPPSILNIDLLDLSRALWVIPELIQVPISQLHPQQPALNSTRFFIKNIGSVPITDIQVSQYPKMITSNIQVREFPREVPILNPGESIPIDLQFQVNIIRSAFENRYLMITGRAAGVNDPIYAYTQLLFTISSPNCLKISNKNIEFNLNIGEKRTRNISVTNKCLEPVSIVGIDKKQDMYTETFGHNPFKIIPSTGANIIYPNHTVTYNLELEATSLGGSPKMPMILVGRLLNSQNPVTSEDFLISINIQDFTAQEVRDQEVSLISTLPICGDLDLSETLNRPKISVNNCSENSGYCDAYTSSQFILSKINDLSNQIKQASSQAQGKTINTGCNLADVSRGFCKISELGNINPVEFTFYMQNDNISTNLLRYVLGKSNYDFKNYLVEINPFDTSQQMHASGVYAAGNKIFLSSNFSGCGKYRVEIDGFIAANHNDIYANRAYYYINILDYEKTEHCEKNIINYLNFLPWNQPLSKNQREGTWLTLFTGNEELSKNLIRGIGKFGSNVDQRYVYGREFSATNNSFLNISLGNIVENQEALAKLYFNDFKDYQKTRPEQINVVLNERYSLEDDEVTENVSRKFVNAISSMMVKNEFLTEVCVSEDKDYLLILDVIEAGDLFFLNKDVYLKLNEEYSCVDLKIKSSIDEVLKITSSQLSVLEVGIKRKDSEVLTDSINLNIKRNEDKEFTVCVKPRSFQDIGTLVGDNITIIANSIYSGQGTIGLRNAEANITFTSCGITPEEFLSQSYLKIITEHNKSENRREFPQTIYGLIDWTSSYNSDNKEELCKTLENYVLSEKYNQRLYFDYYNLGCDIRDPSQRTVAKMSKALENSGVFFATCFGTCALCTMGLNAAFSLFPIIGQIALLKGVVLDCAVFSCGLPALGIFANVATDGKIVDSIDGFLSRLFASEIAPLKSTISVFGKALEAIGSVFAGVHAGVSTSKDALLSVENLVAIENLPAHSDVIVPGPVVPPGPVPVTTAIPADLTTQMRRYVGYFDGTGAYQMTPTATPTGFSNSFPDLLNKFTDSVPGSPNRAFNPGRFQALSATELSELNHYIQNSTYNPSPGVPRTAIRPAPETLVRKIDNYSALRSTTIVPPPAIPGAVSPSLSAINLNEYNDLLSSLEGQVNTLTNDISRIDTQITDLESKRFTSNRSKKIARLKSQKALLENSKNQMDEVVTGLKSATRVGDNMHVSRNTITKLTDMQGQSMPMTANQTRFSRRANFAAGFVRGLACGLSGITLGNNMLSSKGKTNLNYSIEFEQDIVFEKNVMYVAELNYIEPESGDYKSRYTINIVPLNKTNILDSNNIQRIDECVVKEE